MLFRVAFFVSTILLVTLATEILRSSCPSPPDLKPLDNFTLSELNGFYPAVAYYVQYPLLSANCFRMRFTPISANRTTVITRSRGAIYIPGDPIRFDYVLRPTRANGTFDMYDSIFDAIYLGSLYVLSNGTSGLIIFTCRRDIASYDEDVIVLNRNYTYTTNDANFVQAVVQNNTLDWGYIQPINQDRVYCQGVLDP